MGQDHNWAAEMLRTLVAYAAGYGMLELSAPSRVGNQLKQIVRLTRNLPPEAPVRLVEVARMLADCDMDDQFELGLDLIRGQAELVRGMSSEPMVS